MYLTDGQDVSDFDYKKTRKIILSGPGAFEFYIAYSFASSAL